MTPAPFPRTGLPPSTGAHPTSVGIVHATCCDDNVGLCGTPLPGGAAVAGPGRQVVEGNTIDETGEVTCVVCAAIEQQNAPCGPVCDVGLDDAIADLERSIRNTCWECGYTDDTEDDTEATDAASSLDECPTYRPNPYGPGLICSDCAPEAVR